MPRTRGRALMAKAAAAAASRRHARARFSRHTLRALATFVALATGCRTCERASERERAVVHATRPEKCRAAAVGVHLNARFHSQRAPAASVARRPSRSRFAQILKRPKDRFWTRVTPTRRRKIVKPDDTTRLLANLLMRASSSSSPPPSPLEIPTPPLSRRAAQSSHRARRRRRHRRCRCKAALADLKRVESRLYELLPQYETKEATTARDHSAALSCLFPCKFSILIRH